MSDTVFTAKHLAGYCSDLAIWKALIDITSAGSMDIFVNPSDVVVDDDVFSVSRGEKVAEPEAVWSIGALVCYLSTGRLPFGGRGADYHKSHPQAQLPVLRPEHASLSTLMRACLNPVAAQRPTCDEVHRLAVAGYDEVLKKDALLIFQDKTTTMPDDADLSGWPEDMI